MHVDEPYVASLPWWFPPLLLFALLFVWPLMVGVVATAPPPNADNLYNDELTSEWISAYGDRLAGGYLRMTMWTPTYSTRPYLLDTDWARMFPWRLFGLAAVWTIIGVALSRKSPGASVPPWLTWTSSSIALFPWFYLLISAGAGRGYGELIAATWDLRRVGEPISAYSTPIGDPPTETLIALGALVAIVTILLLMEYRATGKVPQFPDLLQIDLQERNPGRVLHDLPRLQRNTNEVLAPAPASGGATSVDPASSTRDQ